jgi:membrane associated rhomboid family serine protease
MQPTQPPAGPNQPDPLYGFAGCYRHPDRLTGVRCIRCDRPICPECQNAGSVGFQCPDDVKAGRATVRRGRTVVGAVPAAGPPLVTYSLIGVNVLFYVLTAISPGGTFVYNYRSQLFNDWVMWPRMVGANHDYVRLMTSAFLHYGPIHILLNMFALYTIGPALETVLGRWRYLSLYLIAALGSSVLCLLFDTVDSGSAGASGAIFGLFAAALVLSKSVGFNSRALWITIGFNFVFTFTVPGISKLGHIGGFVVGGLAALALLGWSLKPRQVGPRLRNIQLASFAAILVVLIGLSVWRTDSLHSQLTTRSLTGAGASPSTVWIELGRTTPV